MSTNATISDRICEFGSIYAQAHPPLTTRFEEEVGKYWGRNWGVTSEVGHLRTVLVHQPGPEIEAIEEPLVRWRYTEKPVLAEMQAAFGRLCASLRDEGVEVIVRKPEAGARPRLVKSIYTRDPSFTVQGGVIIGRLYDALRRGEEIYTAQTYAELGCPILHTLNGSATMEGGSVVWVTPKHLAIGVTPRGNAEGARQVREVVNAAAPEVDVCFVEVDHPSGHLDVPLTMVDVRRAVLDRRCVPDWFGDWLAKEAKVEVIDKPPGTYIEGTVVLRPGRVLYDDGIQEERRRGRALLKGLGLEVVPVNLDTLTFPRNSGTLHCLTMPMIRDAEPA
ncbi:MAG: arginine deiminase family protein [Zavarzinia sp.]|nr:arginine deiminase family protein [Zavarzinia sp.]